MTSARIRHFVTKRPVAAVMVVAAFLLSAGELCAQGLTLAGAGARSEAMGGAFIGVADDATAVVWNPAGLVQLKAVQASVEFRFIDNKADFTVPAWPSLNASAHQSHAALNFGGLALPLDFGTVKLVPALAYHRQIDVYESWVAGTLSRHVKGGVGTITPGFGLKIGLVFSIGASANFWTGAYDEARFTEETPSGQSHLTYTGFNMEAGAFLDLAGLSQSLPVKLGLRWRTPFDLKENGTEGAVRMNITTEMPSMLGVGASVCLFERLTLAADYELMMYAENRLRREAVGYGAWTYRLSGDNIQQYRVGCEHVIVAGQLAIPIRIGYNSVPHSFTYADGPEAKNAYSFGTGIHFTRLAIDAAYTQLNYTVDNFEDVIRKQNATVSLSLAVSM